MPRQKADNKQGPTVLWLLAQIEEFLSVNDMDNDGNTFGWLVSKDRTLVTRLRDGGDISITKMDDVLAFMRCPDRVYRTTTSEGLVVNKTLKPLTIKPKEL